MPSQNLLKMPKKELDNLLLNPNEMLDQSDDNTINGVMAMLMVVLAN
jgi:hypothetical protein